VQKKSVMIQNSVDPYEVDPYSRSYELRIICSEDDKRLERKKVSMLIKNNERLLKKLRLVYETAARKKTYHELKETIRN
jgi:hypothetical protein